LDWQGTEPRSRRQATRSLHGLLSFYERGKTILGGYSPAIKVSTSRERPFSADTHGFPVWANEPLLYIFSVFHGLAGVANAKNSPTTFLTDARHCSQLFARTSEELTEVLSIFPSPKSCEY